MKKKRGQVWIETITYTLVALVIIGLVLAFARPEIQRIQDKTIIDQSISIVNELSQIMEIVKVGGTGTKRRVELNIKKGEIEIDSLNDSLIFRMEGKYQYSELDQVYVEGKLNILTQQKGDFYNISVEKNYITINLTYSGEEKNKILTESPTPYVIFISNKGGSSQNIDFELQ
ncbi:MAG: type II secretion system protein [Nanoarchaeota archaeon]|nr:type II secretion system protein [Nanoarchaeota archaeon]